MERKELKAIEEKITKQFQDCMPKRYFIFSTTPKLYFISNTICIEMPNDGSDLYRRKLTLLRKTLEDSFVMDIHHFDRKVTFILRDKK